MNKIPLFPETLFVLRRAFELLENKIEKPCLVKRGSYEVFRYKTPSLHAAVIQKLAREISGLQAALVLLDAGFVQELGAVFRMLDEFIEAVDFLCEAVRSGRVTELQKEYLTAFYQEEFEDLDRPLLSEQKRPTVSRRRIQAALANSPTPPINPSDGMKLQRTLSQGCSGYVHGASVHIMDMYAGDPPRFQVSGMRNTPRIAEFATGCVGYLYRGILSAIKVAVSFGEMPLAKELDTFRERFERHTGKPGSENLEELLRKAKAKKPDESPPSGTSTPAQNAAEPPESR